MVYKNFKKGQQGIGTLVIFIALILVAAVAAGVLIQTTSSLQGKADVTGSQVQERLGTGFSVIEVGAANTSDGIINGSGSGDHFEVVVRLAPGSQSVKLNDLSITVVTKAGPNSYTYSTGNGAYSTSKFNVTYESNGGNAKAPGYISANDVVRIKFANNNNIKESEKFQIRLFPGVGDPQTIDLVTPSTMLNYYSVLK